MAGNGSPDPLSTAITKGDKTMNEKLVNIVFKIGATFLLCLLLLSNCATSAQNLRKVSIGMTKDQVAENLGEPTVVRGSIMNKYGQVIEVWEYKLAMPTDDNAGTIIGKSALTVITFGVGAISFKGKREMYWLYFYDNKLVQWGQKGDWKQETDRIYEFNFNPEKTLTK